jgi:hypothetical protein
MFLKFLVRRRQSLGRFGPEPIGVEDGAALLRCKLSLDVTEPARPQSRDAIRDLVDVFDSVFFQSFGRFHFEHDDVNLIAAAARLSQPERKSPSGAGGLSQGF